jgi:hypothetical protein
MVFQPATMVCKLVQKQERDSYIQKENQYTKQYKNTEYKNIENIQYKKTNIKRILKNISRVIREKQIGANNNETTYYTAPIYSYLDKNQ